jgi:hypothetical protein
MDKSFHYYCIRVLAEKAGFSAEHAQTIAYASQYTDDATEHGKMTITGIPSTYNYPRLSGNTFDPICTAHSAKSWLRRIWKWARFYLKPDVQRKILMSFHFLPPEALSSNQQEHFDFVTQSNSTLSNIVVDNAIKALSEFANSNNTYGLIKLGIALHTYADTWAHAGFSGRHSSMENDIKEIKIKRKKTFQSVNPLENLISYAAPDVGHAEASTIPDRTENNWKTKYSNKNGIIQRDNPHEFLNAAAAIYSILITVSPNANECWDNLSTKIEPCLRKYATWEDMFQDITFGYSNYTWRAASLRGDSIDWDNFDDEADFQKLHFEYTGNDMRWLLFHKAAYEQRLFLERRIPRSWLST